MSDRVGRRRLLALLAGGTAGTVAGCLTDDGNSDDPGGSDPDEGGSDDPGTTPADVTYGDVVRVEPSFVAEMELHSPDTAVGTQVVHGRDYHLHIETAEGQDVEMYGVDGQLYTVVMGRCDLDSRDPDAGEYVATDQEPDERTASLAPEGTTTIDGEEVYVFEDAGETVYVSTETGHPVRLEWTDGSADFHSWGDTDPIAPPDVDCVE